jgi:hypothetical protein
MEEEFSSDGFVVDCHVSGRVSGCCGQHLSFTASAATHTRYHVKTRFRSVAVVSHMPCDDNPYSHFCEHKFTL